jgi:Flp pilus assembly protein TadG
MTSCKITRGRSRRPSERGAVVVEFALVFTALAMFLFGIIDFSRALYAYNFVSNAAREGTRFAMVRGASCSGLPGGCPASLTDIQNYVKNTGVGVDPKALTVIPSWTPNNKPGSTVGVIVQYSFPFSMPFLPTSHITMKSSSQMVISQ